VLCGATAAIAGVLFAGFTGGPSLNMGSEFLLSSIAVVVIGGTNVAGGQASVLGTGSASLFLFLLLSMLNVYQVDPGLRNVITGVIIIAVLALGKANRLLSQ
jgi:ribose transport system permease protein